MNLLLIGGTRFLGAAIAREVLRRGHSVTVFHRGNTPGTLPKAVQHIYGNAHKPGAIEAAVTEGRYDAVIDTILQSRDLERLLPVFRQHTQRLVHCGSTGVYAPVRHAPAREDDPTPCPPEFGGFAEKAEQDGVLMDFHRATGFITCSLRPSNIFGAGDIPLDLWGARNPRCFARMCAGLPVTVPNDGRALLQPVHVEDLAQAFSAALETDRVAGQIYNVSSERAVTLTHYAELAIEILGSASPIEYAPMEAILATGKANEGGLRFLCEHMTVDIAKAARDLHYAPRWNVRDGLADSLNWMKEKSLIPSP